MPKISVYLTQSLISDDLVLKDKNVIIIDVLRATTTITYALVNGAKEVIPAENPTKAAKIRGASSKLLCGERNGKKIEGFDFGNSPFEYLNDKIKDKILIFSTTNGTVSIIKSKHGKNIVLASFINLSRIVEFIKSLNADVVLLCSGKMNNFCMEDFVCAGAIIKELQNNPEGVEYSISDTETAAVRLAEMFAYKNNLINSEAIFEMFKTTEHGKYLSSLGFTEDLKFASEVDSYPMLPIYSKEVVKLKEQIEMETTQKLSMKKINLTTKDNPK